MLGIGDGRLIEGLLASSDLRLIVVDPDAGKVNALRFKLDDAGYYGMRVSVVVADPRDAGLPPYFASLILKAVTDAAPAGKPALPLQCLRPYGGAVCLDANVINERDLLALAKDAKLDWAEVRRAGDFLLLRRVGALTGAGSWSHQRGNAGNTFSTRDELVRGPLGVLWFGGAAADPQVCYPTEKGGRGIAAQIVGGRILYERPGTISATDVYTGRLLWQWTPLDQEPWYVKPTDDSSSYMRKWGQPTLRGRMASTEDAVYIVSGRHFYAVDAATGKPLAGFEFAEQDQWDSPKIWEDRVFLSSARRVVALDRHTGKVLWSFNEFGGELAAGGGKVFCRQSPKGRLTVIAGEAGEATDASADKTEVVKLAALDAKTGARLWSKDARILRSRGLIYSEEHDRLWADGIYAGQTGEAIGKRPRMGDVNAAVLKDRILMQNNSGGFSDLRDLVTGETIRYPDPITKIQMTDAGNRGGHYAGGCSPAVAGERILAFRADTAAYYDLGLHAIGRRTFAGRRGDDRTSHADVVPLSSLARAGRQWHPVGLRLGSQGPEVSDNPGERRRPVPPPRVLRRADWI